MNKKKRIKMPPARRTIPDLVKLQKNRHMEWRGDRASFNAVYNKARRHKVQIRSMVDPADPGLIHYWRVG